jgi:hypothetical protein
MENNNRDLRRRKYLRSKFEDGDRPNGQSFADLIDSSLNQKSDKIFGVDHKIGIGTENPNAPLEVSGARKEVNQSFLTGDGCNSTFRIAHPENGVLGMGCDESERLQIGAFKNDGSSFEPHMVIDKNGSVGIGTERPEVKLDISGSLKVDQNILLGDCLLAFNNGKLFLKTGDAKYHILMENVDSKPAKPDRYKLLFRVMIFICIFLIMLFLLEYWSLKDPTTTTT